MTYYGLGGAARWLARPRSVEQLREIVRRARREDMAVRILGKGANLLVSDDGVDGVVVRMDHPELSGYWFEGLRLIAGGGANMMRVVIAAARRGLGGLECMAGIPGTVGGCLHANAGGRYGEIGDRVTRVACVDADGELVVHERGALRFGYRTSNLGDAMIVSADFELEPGDVSARRERLREIWAYKKSTQPLAERSTGCVFRNPKGESAGSLIDRAGMKGLSCGGARVSEVHANFIVAENGAKAADVRQLIDRVRDGVARTFDVELELEIEMW